MELMSCYASLLVHGAKKVTSCDKLQSPTFALSIDRSTRRYFIYLKGLPHDFGGHAACDMQRKCYVPVRIVSMHSACVCMVKAKACQNLKIANASRISKSQNSESSLKSSAHSTIRAKLASARDYRLQRFGKISCPHDKCD